MRFEIPKSVEHTYSAARNEDSGHLCEGFRRGEPVEALGTHQVLNKYGTLD